MLPSSLSAPCLLMNVRTLPLVDLAMACLLDPGIPVSCSVLGHHIHGVNRFEFTDRVIGCAGKAVYVGAL